MGTTHTPGPWDFSGPHGRMAQNKCADYIAQNQGDKSPQQYSANARLIAAAPDLLAALELILSYDDMVVGADEARAAIAKARGEG